MVSFNDFILITCICEGKYVHMCAGTQRDHSY